MFPDRCRQRKLAPMSTETYPPAATFRAKYRGTLRLISTVIVAAAALWLGGFFWFVSRIKDDPAPFDAPVDGIVVLTGGADRLAVGLDLLRRGEAKRLLISGVHPDTGPADLSENSIATAELFDCCVDLGRAARDTRGNALEAAHWTADHAYKRIIIVTSDYHMPRTLVEFRSAMPKVQLLPYPVHPSDIHLEAWWRYPGTTRLLASEYTKYLLTLALHGLPGPRPRNG